MKIRKNLQDARKAAGLTQEDLAEKLRISARQYQRMEAGTSNGAFRHWDALEDLLGIHQRILREIRENHPDQEENP